MDCIPMTKCVKRLRRWVGALACAGMTTLAYGASAPSVIKVGTLYASTGAFGVASQSEFAGLKLWAEHVNRDGGVYVKAFGKKIPVKIVAYDDQSSTTTATTLYNELITQDKVDLLVSDFGSVLTSVAIPLAAEHRMLLLDTTGSGANFFTQKTDYLADVSIPSSSVWAIPLARFLLSQHVQRVAIVYGANDFGASLERTLREELAKGGVKPVYDHAVPTSETNYMVLLHTIKATNPQAVLEFGYPPNDIAFLRTLAQSGMHFDLTFTTFPGQLLDLLKKNVGAAGLAYTYTYPTPPQVKYDKVTFGPNTDEVLKIFQAEQHKAPNFLAAAGYNTGLIAQRMLELAPQFTQLDFHQALVEMSGKTTTFFGPFEINANGAQLGQPFPIGQLLPRGNDVDLGIVYPPQQATAKAVYPAPAR